MGPKGGKQEIQPYIFLAQLLYSRLYVLEKNDTQK